MRPDDEVLNRAAALVCGWVIFGDTASSPSGSANAIHHPPHTGRELQPWPDYVNDRNALPELLAVVKQSTEEVHFGELLMCNARGEQAADVALDILLIEPREIVTAALQALGLWESGWSDEGGAECPTP